MVFCLIQLLTRHKLLIIDHVALKSYHDQIDIANRPCIHVSKKYRVLVKPHLDMAKPQSSPMQVYLLKI